MRDPIGKWQRIVSLHVLQTRVYDYNSMINTSLQYQANTADCFYTDNILFYKISWSEAFLSKFDLLPNRQLCLLLHAENIFHSMADILLKEEDLKFASTMVQTLNTILLTSAELFQLRNQLKDLRTQVAHALRTGTLVGLVW